MGYTKMRRQPAGNQADAYRPGQDAGDGRIAYHSNSIGQAKLEVGGADTAAEREADRIAAQVTGGSSSIHDLDGAMEAVASEQGEEIQRSMEASSGGDGFSAGMGTERLMGASASRALDRGAADEIGEKLGADFSDVRIHTDSHAEEVASGMSARAFTRGKDIYFNRGQYSPGTEGGRQLLAHELTHTIQQGQVAQDGGEAVSQTAPAGTAQRGYFDFRKHFEKAVDERNMYRKDYDSQDRMTRLKWSMKHPLARALADTESNQQKTREREARRRRLATVKLDTGESTWIDPNSIHWADANAMSNLQADLEGKANAARAGRAGNQAGNQAGVQADSKAGDIKDDAETGLTLGNHATDTVGVSIGDGVSADAFGIGANVMGAVNDVLSTIDSVMEARSLQERGDDVGAAAKGLDAGGSILSTGQNALGTVQTAVKLAGDVGASEVLGKIAPGVGIASGAGKMSAGATRFGSATKVRKDTEQLRHTYAEEYYEKKKDLTKEEKGRYKDLIGMMRMGKNTAKVNQTGAVYNILEGMFNTASSGSMLAGQPIAATTLSIGATGVGAAGKLHTKHRRKKLRNEELERTYDLDDQIEKLLKRSRQADEKLEESKRLNMTPSEAKHLILESMGYANREAAYTDLAQNRYNTLNKASTPIEQRNDVLKALHIDSNNPQKEKDTLKSLGVKGKYTSNGKVGVIEEEKKKKLVSWRR